MKSEQNQLTKKTSFLLKIANDLLGLILNCSFLSYEPFVRLRAIKKVHQICCKYKMNEIRS